MELMLLTTSPVATVLMNEIGELLSIHDSIDDELISSIHAKQVICDNNNASLLLRKAGINVKIDLSNKILTEWRKNRFELLKNNTGRVVYFPEYYDKIRGSAIKDTRTEVKDNSAKSDEIVAQIIHSIDDLQKSVNLASNRLSEIYSLHFPEMVDIISNTITLARVVLEVPQRKDIDEKVLSSNGIPKNKIDLILKFTDDSLGGDLVNKELVPLQEYASSLIYMYESMRKLENWVEESMSTIAPNLTAVTGPNVGARLISAMGSLKALAMKSSSKIQIIGAERALYSALRTRGKPPKHGIIFQIPEIGNSPYWVRGKIARAFASKIVIAARIDLFDGEFIGDKMRADLREFEKKVRDKFPNAPPPKKVERKYHGNKARGKTNKNKGRQSRRRNFR